LENLKEFTAPKSVAELLGLLAESIVETLGTFSCVIGGSLLVFSRLWERGKRSS
jgi:hypothetical protein